MLKIPLALKKKFSATSIKNMLVKLREDIRPPEFNALLLKRLLLDENIPETTINSVTQDLESAFKKEHFNEETFTCIFAKHDIAPLAGKIFYEIRRDLICCPYGSIGCP